MSFVEFKHKKYFVNNSLELKKLLTTEHTKYGLRKKTF